MHVWRLFTILWQTGARIGEVLKTPKTPGLRPCDIAKNGISMVTEKKRHSKFKRKNDEWIERKTPLDKVKVYRRNIPISSELYAEIMEYCFKARISHS